jgi:uncharacterized protein YjgD (DUF1641 family)
MELEKICSKEKELNKLLKMSITKLIDNESSLSFEAEVVERTIKEMEYY